MIPLRDNAAPRRLTPVNIALIAVNVAVFAYELSLGPRVAGVVEKFALVPAAVTRAMSSGAPGGLHPLEPLITIVTSMFIHGGFWHIAGNMLYLFIFGAAVEYRMGSARYLLFYLAAGIAAALATVWIAPNSNVPVIGASGAIAGVLGAHFMLCQRGRDGRSRVVGARGRLHVRRRARPDAREESAAAASIAVELFSKCGQSGQ